MDKPKEKYEYNRPEMVELTEYVENVLSGLDEYSGKLNEKTIQIFSHGMSSYYVNTEWET